MAKDEAPEWVFCFYRVVPGKEEELVELMGRHDQAVRKLGLVTDEPTQVWRGADDRGRPFFVKLFEWRSGEAVERAHEHPEVLAVWERMDPLCEPRDGRPGMEFPHVERVALP